MRWTWNVAFHGSIGAVNPDLKDHTQSGWRTTSLQTESRPMRHMPNNDKQFNLGHGNKIMASQKSGSFPSMRAGEVLFFIIGQELSMNIINQAKIDSVSIIICWTRYTLHELVFPLMAHKNRNCIGTPSTCCGRSNQVSGSMLYQMSFLANLAVMQQEQSWKDPFWLFFLWSKQMVDSVVQVASNRWTALNSTSNNAALNLSQNHYFCYLMNRPHFQSFTSTN